MNADAFLARAMSARETPTTYFLDYGAWGTGDLQPHPRPGTPIVIRTALAQMARERPRVHAKYLAAMREHQIDLDTLPKEACDCTNFLCWALGVARDSGPWPANAGRINTTNILADAFGAQTLFVPLDDGRARKGAIVVYAAGAPGAEGEVGHAGIVTDVDDAGRATRVLHCAPENYLLAPPPGLPRNAIAETGADRFDAVRPPHRHVVWWKAFER